jgi:pimeloyl-ACP methyl ester carboxylesterase
MSRTSGHGAPMRAAIQLAAIRAGFTIGGTFAPKATARRAARWFGTPSAAARARSMTVDDAGAEHGHVDVGNERIATYAWGDPSTQPIVLLAHGWSSYGLRFVPWVRPLRAAGCAVVAFDQVGHGRSSGATSNLPQFVRHLRAVALHFGNPTAVIGHSMGGAATAIALSEGLPAERALLIAPAADLAAALTRFTRLVGVPSFLQRRVSRAVEDAADVRFANILMHPQVPRISQPALIVHDIDDADVPWEEGERYARYWPAARLLSTEGLGHHRILVDAGVMAAGLRFLSGDTVGERIVSSPNLPYGVA